MSELNSDNSLNLASELSENVSAVDFCGTCHKDPYDVE